MFLFLPLSSLFPGRVCPSNLPFMKPGQEFSGMNRETGQKGRNQKKIELPPGVVVEENFFDLIALCFLFCSYCGMRPGQDSKV